PHLEILVDPFIDGDIEPLLSLVGDLRGQSALCNSTQHPLTCAAVDLEMVGQKECEADQIFVDNWPANLKIFFHTAQLDLKRKSLGSINRMLASVASM